MLKLIIYNLKQTKKNKTLNSFRAIRDIVVIVRCKVWEGEENNQKYA